MQPDQAVINGWRDSAPFWEKHREIAAREPDRVVLIEGDLSIDEVHEQILEAVSERIVTAPKSA